MLHIDDAAEASMESFWARYESGELDPSVQVLKSLGHRPEAVDFVLNPDSYYFPNRRGDHFIKPSSVSDDQIPILALESGRRYHFEKPSLHYLQRTALEATGLSRWVIRDAERAFATFDDEIEGNAGPAGTASVRRILAQVRDLPERSVESKPSLIFNVDGPQAVGAFCVGVTLHELTHVSQSLSDPIWDEAVKPRLRRELEAYAVQAPLLNIDSIPFNDATRKAALIDSLRRKYLGENEFEPTELLTEQLAQHPELQGFWIRLNKSA